jgi:hypothetical protein
VHVHKFERCQLTPIAGGRFTAWVRESVARIEPTPDAWRCACGEQGYEICDR